ncbi:hypothetical protein FOPG_09201 [Fusarium oxysporum f. sp. conglutinans race 2 54008]|uniref:Uncharacterized protein n=1 Tax=Fusarium oxysporum f. sp. conglutinans race 2 54008 TaxID=1089457 RepID=X0HH91_FUSOX|nr:hypothetical protein FOPG_09201 [Fusarium oxysporum f. sp. conglutinans race 2 54008]
MDSSQTYSYQRCSSPCLRTEPAGCQCDTLATRGRTSVDKFLRYDAARWTDLRNAFEQAVAEAGRIDLATSNAGVSEQYDYFSNKSDEWGKLLEPAFGVTDVNFRAVNSGGIVITSSATAHAPEHDLPVYGASKLATVELMRSLRSTFIMDDFTVNAVTPADTSKI